MIEKTDLSALVNRFLQELETLADIGGNYKTIAERREFTTQADPEIGTAPDYLIPHCITHNAIFLMKKRMAEKSGNADFRIEPEDVATKFLDGQTPSQKSSDITRLPSLIEEVAASCGKPGVFKLDEIDELKRFQELLGNMLRATHRLIKTKSEVRVALGLEPIKIAHRPCAEEPDKIPSVLARQ